MFRPMTRVDLMFDVIVASVCLLLRFLIGIGEAWMLFVVIAMAAALGLRRVSPAIALAVAWAGAILQVSAGLHPDVANLAILPVLYCTARFGMPVVKWSGLASAILGATVIALYNSLGAVVHAFACTTGRTSVCGFEGQIRESVTSLFIVFFFALVVFVLSWTFGLLAKTWRRARENSEAVAVEQRERLAAQRDVAIEQERTRIARDMHDVVAHSLAVVIAQADGARYAGAKEPGAVDAALVAISRTARQALGEVRVLLGQLRHNQGDAPQPTVADLQPLFQQLRASGLTVTFSETGDVVSLTAGQQLAVYRIVQEALTNALRHGDASEEVSVSLDWSAESVTIEVSNAVTPAVGESVVADDPRLSHGLAGMSERAKLWGGTFAAGRIGQTYGVRVVLPIAVQDSAEDA
ncbi:sensor histidine kinase [Parafrigoribacterium humi]|uniref:sensor histidine kinase n=1 Tax=Parafrigoribacterium humi TaxID=3144664 RepID=UPI0032EFEFB1